MTARQTLVARCLAAFWKELEKQQPRNFYAAISFETFEALNQVAAQAVTERIGRDDVNRA